MSNRFEQTVRQSRYADGGQGKKRLTTTTIRALQVDADGSGSMATGTEGTRLRGPSLWPHPTCSCHLSRQGAPCLRRACTWLSQADETQNQHPSNITGSARHQWSVDTATGRGGRAGRAGACCARPPLDTAEGGAQPNV